jgi:hypothetical protein
MRILDKGAFRSTSSASSRKTLVVPGSVAAAARDPASHGPDRLGKTTTLYTALEKLNQPDVKILTVEDPVEYQMVGINQIQVALDLTFANASARSCARTLT